MRDIFTGSGTQHGSGLKNLFMSLLMLSAFICRILFLGVHRNHSVGKCIVVRHLSPSDEIIMNSDSNSESSDDILGKRPCKQLKVSQEFNGRSASAVSSQLVFKRKGSFRISGLSLGTILNCIEKK